MSFLSDIFRVVKNALTWWVSITPWEAGLRVRTLPRRPPQVTILKAGLHWAFPICDTVYKQSTRLRISDLPIQTLTTTDGKTLTVKGMIGYTIKNIKKLYDNLQHGEDALTNIATGVIAEYVATRASTEFTPAMLEEAVLEKLDFEQYGLGKTNLKITDFAYVKSYRLIQGDNWYSSGDTLNTNRAAPRNGGGFE